SSVGGQHSWRAVHIINDDVDIAIVVEIAESAAARELLRDDSGTRSCRYVFETSIAEIAIKNFGLPVTDVQLSVCDLRIDVSVGEKKVLPAVVIKIQETNAEAEIFSIYPKSSLDACVFKGSISIVVI